jgi:hypothetical protein
VNLFIPMLSLCKFLIGRTPKVSEIFKECKKAGLPPAAMERACKAVVNFVTIADALKSAAQFSAEVVTGGSTNDLSNAPAPKITLKSPAIVQKITNEQLEHVRSGCLTVPANITMHHEVNGKTYNLQSTGINERVNGHANRDVLKASTIGSTRAERELTTFFDEWNQSVNVNHRGADKYTISNLESLAFLNSLASQQQYEIPFVNVSMPSLPDYDEKIGFELDQNSSHTPSDSVQAAMTELTIDDAPTFEPVSDDEHDPDADYDDAEFKVSQMLLSVSLEREIKKSPKTMELFCRVIGCRPWIPFNQEANDPISVEEIKLFGQMSTEYERHTAPSSTRGYGKFAKCWDAEAWRRQELALQGEEVVIIYRKTPKQLQDCFDMLQEKEHKSLVANEAGDRNQRAVGRTYRPTIADFLKATGQNMEHISFSDLRRYTDRNLVRLAGKWEDLVVCQRTQEEEELLEASAYLDDDHDDFDDSNAYDPLSLSMEEEEGLLLKASLNSKCAKLEVDGIMLLSNLENQQ